ncbi:MAG TPA: GntR family transcriptional regulator [Chiayiivirga sp.]|nr:GntR family transcriptional regulator [Chiayiivirga sp.]
MKERRKSRYQQIGEELQLAIEQGHYPLGSLLPTELELCRQYDISRHTARAALARLSDAGMVLRRPGAGTRVVARRAAMHCACEANSIEQLLQYGKTSHLELLSARRRAAGASAAELLGMAQGTDHLHLLGVRLNRAGGNPVALTDMLLPVYPDTPVDELLDPARASAALTRLLDMARLSIVEQTFDVDVFSAIQARHLDVAPRDPALRAQRRYVDNAGRLLMVATSLHPRERFAHRAVLSRGGH